jgi:hypothetical protein
VPSAGSRPAHRQQQASNQSGSSGHHVGLHVSSVTDVTLHRLRSTLRSTIRHPASPTAVTRRNGAFNGPFTHDLYRAYPASLLAHVGTLAWRRD